MKEYSDFNTQITVIENIRIPKNVLEETIEEFYYYLQLQTPKKSNEEIIDKFLWETVDWLYDYEYITTNNSCFFVELARELRKLLYEDLIEILDTWRKDKDKDNN